MRTASKQADRLRKNRRYLDFEVLESRLPVSEKIGTVISLSALYTAGTVLAQRGAAPVLQPAPAVKLTGLDSLAGARIRVVAPSSVRGSEESRPSAARTEDTGKVGRLEIAGSWAVDPFDRWDLDPIDALAAPSTRSHRAIFQADVGGEATARGGAADETVGLPPNAVSTYVAGSDAGLQTGTTGYAAPGLPPDGTGLPPAISAPSDSSGAASTPPAKPISSPLDSGSGNDGPAGPTNDIRQLPTRHPPHRGRDPLSVLDANYGVVLTPQETNAYVVKHDFSGYAVDLRAQVSSAVVSTYQWTHDTSNPSDFSGWSGASTFNLTFTWGSFSGKHGHTITLQTTNVGGGGITYNYNFTVYGTDYQNGAAPTSWSTWQPGPALTVLRPDALTDQQETVDHPYYSLGLTTGELLVNHSLPTYNLGIAPLTLEYSSVAADRQLIFIGHYVLNGGVSTITAKLTLNGVTGPVYTYDTSQLNPSDIMHIPLQASASGLSTGRYSYSFTVIEGVAITVANGSVNIIDEHNGIFGNGWSLANVQRLWPVTGGVILELPEGRSLWFAGSGPNFTTPPGDFSTLALSGSVYTRNLKDGTKIKFTSLGGSDPSYRQTSIVDRNNNTTTFTYDGNQNLSSITDFNNQVTTFSYSGGTVSTITDPANRLITLGYDNKGRLNSITDPAPGGGATTPIFTFTYDPSSVDRITQFTDPRSNITTFTYSSAGRSQNITRPDTTGELLVPQQTQGLPLGTLTANSPVLAAEALTSYYDGELNQWNTRFDWLGFGRATAKADPLTNEKDSYRDPNGLAWLTSDQIARRTRYFFDATNKDNPTKIVLPDDNVQLYSYNMTFSLVTKFTDELTDVTTYTRDSSTGNLTQLIQPSPDGIQPSPVWTYTYYSPGGWLKSRQDPRSNITTFTYDNNNLSNRLVKVTYPTDAGANPTMAYGYDTYGNVNATTNERLYTTTTVYDALNRLTQRTLPADTGPNPVWNYGYDAASNQTSVTNPLSKIWTTTYDVMNRRSTVNDPLSHVWTYTYDGNGLSRTATDPHAADPNPHTTTYSYDGADHLVGITDPLVHTMVYGYDPADQQITMTDPLGHTTTYTYSTRGWEASEVDPVGYQRVSGYNAAGDRTSVTEHDASGSPTPLPDLISTATYDALHRRTTTVDPLGKTTSYGYDSVGNQTSVAGPVLANLAGNCCGAYHSSAVDFTHGTGSFTYDKRNRLISRKDALILLTTFSYDAAGNRTAVTDPLLHTTTYGFDAQNRVKAVTQPSPDGVQVSPVTTTTYDLAGRLLSVTDPDNNVTTYGYDDANRQTSMADANNKVTTNAYDEANRLVGKTDRRGQHITYTYDAADRRTSEIWLDGSFNPVRTITYGLDNANRLTSANDPAALYTYTYDNADELTSVDTTLSGGVTHVLLTYSYDTYHNRTNLTDNQGSGGAFTYNYDGDHHLTYASLGVGSTQGPQATLSYDSRNRLGSLVRAIPSGVTITSSFLYDLDDRLTTLTHNTPTSPLATYTYHYDNASRIDGYSGLEGSRTYAYDNLNQLTTATNASTGAVLESYAYDLNGNRTSGNGVTYGAPGTDNRLLNDGVYTYTYDNEANLLTRRKISNGEVATFTWDYRNRLTEVVVGLGSTITQDDRFTYDVNDRRIGKLTLGGSQLWMIYDGGNTYADFNGSSLGNRYLYGLGLDSLFARTDASAMNPARYLTDRLGSVRQVANSAAQVTDTITYDTFGNVLSETGTGDRYKWTGRELDTEIAFQYNRARYYASSSGRWISQDPLRQGGGDSNLYRYVWNRPTSWADPSGLRLEWTEISIAAPSKTCGCTFLQATYDKPTTKQMQDEGDLFKMNISAEFIKDDTHAPECCEYRQWVKSRSLVVRGGRTIYEDSNDWHDDGYSRADDEKQRGYESTQFSTIDEPGYEGLTAGDVVDTTWWFKHEIYDTCPPNKGKVVKRLGPIKAHVNGKAFDGFTWRVNGDNVPKTYRA